MVSEEKFERIKNLLFEKIRDMNIIPLDCQEIDVEKNYNLAKKYYLMAIELDNVAAMNNLAFFYEHVEKNYPQAKKYYLMAVDHDSIWAMYNISLYYRYIEKNKNLAMKYLIQATEMNKENAEKQLLQYDKNVLADDLIAMFRENKNNLEKIKIKIK